MSRAGQKIIAGLNDAIAFAHGDRLAGRLMQRQPDGSWRDISAEWLRERGVASKKADLRLVEKKGALHAR